MMYTDMGEPNLADDFKIGYASKQTCYREMDPSF